MDDTVYRGLVNHLASVPVIAAPNLKKLAKEHGVQEETVYSIYSQEINNRVMKMHSALRSAAVGLLKRYAQGEDIAAIVLEWRMPPCVVMRRLLECCTALGVKGSKHVTTLLKDPSSLQEVDTESVRKLFEDLEISIINYSPSEFVHRLVQDMQWCTECDMVCGPSSDVARLKAGEEYEKKMYECLERAGISFWTENELRGQGFHKTPDARLRVPIAVGERVVCWMDSKATFGDLKMHQKWLDEQYKSYVNRFGPGVVIYWHGYLRDVEASGEDVLVLGAFPDSNDITKLPVLL